MSKLVPTVITDVNGRITTVHRKAVDQGKAVPMPMPAVSTPNRQDDETVASTVVALGLRMAFVNDKVRESIAMLSTDDIELLRQSLDSPPPNIMHPSEFQAAMVYPLNFNDGDAGRYLKNTMIMLESSMPVYHHKPFLQTLGKHNRFKEAAHDLYAADDDTKKLILGIANAVYSLTGLEIVTQDKYGNESIDPMINATGKYMKLRDPALMPALLDHPEHAGAIASLCIKRGNIDALDEVINTSTAISDGAL